MSTEPEYLEIDRFFLKEETGQTTSRTQPTELF